MSSQILTSLRNIDRDCGSWKLIGALTKQATSVTDSPYMISKFFRDLGNLLPLINYGNSLYLQLSNHIRELESFIITNYRDLNIESLLSSKILEILTTFNSLDNNNSAVCSNFICLVSKSFIETLRPTINWKLIMDTNNLVNLCKQRISKMDIV